MPIRFCYQCSGESMDKQQMQKILVPAAAIAGIVVLAGLIIGLNPPEEGDGKGTQSTSGGSSTGLSQLSFALDDDNWKPLQKIKIWDVREGQGEPCAPGSTVTIHYTGWLTNGKKFDSSRDRGEKATFGLRGLIQGWQMGIPGMKPGGIRRLLIPPELGYGSQDKGDIPPNSTLVFEVEYFGS